ncbi:hypothetical protein [Ferrovibrio sp.]|uniref:hypothetical protein n=1 Tax=Ferrovibrio sp. TaxID=1917215 RepID=UPI0025BB6B06|nr:hypothetical protein [Ferrovibrio sp.]MBX3456439.1 hypothetical protein [Ferrovibrio sp.]
MNRPASLVAVLALSVLALAGCQSAQLGGGNTKAPDSSSRSAPPQISGIALPEGYSLDTNRTIILGEGERWIGRLSYSINSSANDMFDFIRREMLNHGWVEVSVVRSEISHLTYMSAQGDRVASILVNAASLYGSRVELTVSPAAGGGPSVVPATRNVGPQPARR